MILPSSLQPRHSLRPSINIFVWAIAICCHAACTNFAGLFVVRLVLGACEGAITAGFMIVSSMFYTRAEQTLRVGYWCPSSPPPSLYAPANACV